MNGATVKVYSKAKDGSKALSKNFKVKEFACNDGSDPIFISMELVDLLQKIRDHFGKPVTINSAYRTVTKNKACGGATYSQHLYGTAADISISSRISRMRLAIISPLSFRTLTSFCMVILRRGLVQVSSFRRRRITIW